MYAHTSRYNENFHKCMVAYIEKGVDDCLYVHLVHFGIENTIKFLHSFGFRNIWNDDTIFSVGLMAVTLKGSSLFVWQDRGTFLFTSIGALTTVPNQGNHFFPLKYSIFLLQFLNVMRLLLPWFPSSLYIGDGRSVNLINSPFGLCANLESPEPQQGSQTGGKPPLSLLSLEYSLWSLPSGTSQWWFLTSETSWLFWWPKAQHESFFIFFDLRQWELSSSRGK